MSLKGIINIMQKVDDLAKARGYLYYRQHNGNRYFTKHEGRLKLTIELDNDGITYLVGEYRTDTFDDIKITSCINYMDKFEGVVIEKEDMIRKLINNK